MADRQRAGSGIRGSLSKRRWLLRVTMSGEVFRVNAGRVEKVFVFSDRVGQPHIWMRPPRNFVLWRAEWLVSDFSNHLYRFDLTGIYRGLITLSFRPGAIVVAGDSLWALNTAAPDSTRQFWRSTDGVSFSPIQLSSGIQRFDSPLGNLVLVAGDRKGLLYEMSIIGPPILHRAYPPGARLDISLAYSRSRARARRDHASGYIQDVSPYSLPVRDLLPLTGGRIVVLRNREDVRTASGQLVLDLGRRADLYAAQGQHRMTATFPASVNWIVETTPSAVLGMTRSGDLVVARWQRAELGGIVEP